MVIVAIVRIVNMFLSVLICIGANVPTLVAVGVKYLHSFRLKTELCKYKTNF